MNKALKWHKFQIYFSLWIGALSALGWGSSFLNGTVYGDNTARVYARFPTMQRVDVLFGCALIALAAYQIYVRFQLAGFKRQAPQKLLLLHIISFVIPFMYRLLVTVEVGVSAFPKLGEFLGELIAPVILFLVNRKYYDNRKELFVN